MAITDSQRSPTSDIEDYILQFAEQFGAGELEVIAYLQTTSGAQNTQCSLDEIDVNFK